MRNGSPSRQAPLEPEDRSDETSSSPHSSHTLLLHNTALALVLWTGGVTASWWWSYSTYQQRLVELARVEAATNINKDWSLRLWATSHGGVYVPPDEKTPPNPYLARIPERDIITDKGKRLTLMNPEYMMRQIMQSYSDLYGVRGHITSLQLTNPINVPDAWETASLKSFQQGVKEAVTIAEIEGKPYLRMMRPIPMEKGCLKCHADTGIKVGEIRGGVSTAIPMEPYYLAFEPEFRNTGLVHGMVWLLGAGVIGFIARRAKREADAIDRYQGEINRFNQELEQRVAARTAQLEAANKELESFSYSVSHDLRTPLRAINGFSTILLDDYANKLDEEGKRMLDAVRDNTVRMGQLIDDILHFTRIGRMEISCREIDMERLAHAVVDELRPSIADGKVQLEIEAIPHAWGDSAMLHQVFFSLLSNAIKFSRMREPAKIKVGGSIEGDEAVYYVKDNGVGFDMQYAGKLFGVFQRLHRVNEFEGTGIGLAVVKRIVTRHGGRVWAEGKVNEGATIHFALPTKEAVHG
jgi:signal transduction histidine kinase